MYAIHAGINAYEPPHQNGLSRVKYSLATSMLILHFRFIYLPMLGPMQLSLSTSHQDDSREANSWNTSIFRDPNQLLPWEICNFPHLSFIICIIFATCLLVKYNVVFEEILGD